MSLTPARKIAAAAALALAASAVAAVAPASAASGVLNYTCKDQGEKFLTVVDTDAPLNLTANTASAPIKGTATITVPKGIVDLMRSVGIKRVEGTASVTSVLNGVAKTSTFIVPSTAVPDTGDTFPVVSAGEMYSIPAAASGATNTINAGAFSATLQVYNSTGGKVLPDGFALGPCTPDAGQNLLVDSVPVTDAPTTPAPIIKVDTKTTVKAKFAKAKKTITAKVKVAGTDAKPGTGKVKVTLKLGKKKIKTIKAKLSANGAAKAVFKKISKKGKYKVEVVYAGSETQNPSKAKSTVKVK